MQHHFLQLKYSSIISTKKSYGCMHHIAQPNKTLEVRHSKKGRH